jgi:hypothetical protein
MKHFLSGVMAAGWFCMAIAVFAQSISTSSEPVISAPAAADPSAGGSGKRSECLAAVEDKAGQDLQDELQLCLAEGRLYCLKQAIAHKIVGVQRKDFVENCMTGD